ncbi:fungal-specific transcription factor domain-domain-containing protein [Kockovaella imperatae]|uniref:Fungal-specific transcription factor domain-domain-containing protein n=1 Tax=Kockovaella imperatae TaxID=4999 RepID=A0A1Y1UMZ6_9TREE|nr:fungal-specific transcription factor domain-domain-containing protein [Kockovaella imperatae]ORX39389.1 fungal-specific transcription factor domain-domain-containing protein [Kockovaella imperatae]
MTKSETDSIKAAPTKTCDNCRKRKIKCVESEVGDKDVCEGCRKLALACTYDYVKKKPGRKNSYAIALKAAQEHRSMEPPQPNNESRPNWSRSNTNDTGPHRNILNSSHVHPFTPYPPPDSVRSTNHQPPISPTVTTNDRLMPMLSAGMDTFEASPGFMTPGRPWSSFAFSPRIRNGLPTNGDTHHDPHELNGLDWLDSLLEGTVAGSLGTSAPGGPEIDFSNDVSLSFPNIFPSDQAHLLALESPENLAASTSSSGQLMGPRALLASRREPQLEDVASWANISHFISLFLQYLYPLLPLVHRPTFAENLATRRDLKDTDFRALLLSIVAYVISQLPTSRLVSETFDIEGLKRLQRRCHRTCKSLQRTYYGPTNLTQITTIIFDTFYLLSIGLGHTAGSRLGQAVQLAFAMGMHSDEKTNTLGLDSIEIQLRRRVFWQLYASDKTRATPGMPMLINDFQGTCSLPEPIDDEFITSQGMFPQPPGRTSVLAGFVCLSKIFKILSECFFHHRCLATGLRTVGMEWSIEAEDKLHETLREMPAAIQDPSVSTVTSMRGVFAMQRANILITAAITKFALYDLRAALHVDEEQLAKDREGIAREIHSLLMNIPVEDLASNGESVRGKVFHIACALCAAQGTDNQSSQDLIKDWCNMFSAISYVQMPPPPPGAPALDSRANTPPHDDPPENIGSVQTDKGIASVGSTTHVPGST